MNVPEGAGGGDGDGDGFGLTANAEAAEPEAEADNPSKPAVTPSRRATPSAGARFLIAVLPCHDNQAAGPARPLPGIRHRHGLRLVPPGNRATNGQTYTPRARQMEEIRALPPPARE